MGRPRGGEGLRRTEIGMKLGGRGWEGWGTGEGGGGGEGRGEKEAEGGEG